MTGSTGFTGKCLVRILEDSGHEIWHLVRNKKGLKRELVWDFSSPLPEGLPLCDILVHLAADVKFSRNFEFTQYNVNTVPTIKLAAYANAHNVYFIFASTVSVHGSQYTEINSNTPIQPENHYAVSKYLAEEVIKTYVENHSILRICGIYGLDGPTHLGLNKALSDAIHNRISPILRGPGKAKRNYISVNDVARWIFCLTEKYETLSISTRNNIRETLYLGGPEVKTIEEYLELIVKMILPGMKLVRIAGPESLDLVLKTSLAPFPQLTFNQYLSSLIASD